VTLRATIAAAAVALLLVPCALASSTATPNEIGLAKALKVQLQTYFKKKVPGTKFTTVSCKISRDQTTAKCAARFTRGKLKATYQVAVAADAAGNTNWQVDSVACANAKTGARVVKNCR
jgi:hypothetical protein